MTAPWPVSDFSSRPLSGRYAAHSEHHVSPKGSWAHGSAPSLPHRNYGMNVPYLPPPRFTELSSDGAGSGHAELLNPRREAPQSIRPQQRTAP
jgi:hypothetical protein